MAGSIHHTTAVYAIVLIIAAAIVYAVDVNIPATGLAVPRDADVSVTIVSITPAAPKYLDKRITITFAMTGGPSTSLKSIFHKFTLAYPSGKKVAYTAFIPVNGTNQTVPKTFLWNLDQRGTYTLTAQVDPNNSIRETNEQNNIDRVVFKIL